MATKKAAAKGKATPLDPKVAGKLLDKLGSDNAFRRLFKQDPAAALAKVGHVLDKDAATACVTVDHIATKREITAAREELKNYLTSGAALTIIFCFEAGKVASSLRRK